MDNLKIAKTIHPNLIKRCLDVIEISGLAQRKQYVS
jgi:hypothetical protein